MPTYPLTQHDTINHLSFDQKGKLNKFLSIVALYYRRHHTRKQLAKLSSTQLQDIGLSQEEAQMEASQPFWK